MSLNALFPLAGRGPFAPPNAGPPPKLDWLELKLLRIDRSYQRAVSATGEKTIMGICRHFQWAKFSPLIVAPAEGGFYAIVDGQHRAIAALMLGYELVPCASVKATALEQAAVFAAVNGDVTRITIMQLFRAALRAGEAWALELDQTCKAAGLEPLTRAVMAAQMQPRQTLAIGTVRKYIARHGADVVTAALRAEMAKPDAGVPGHFNAVTIRAAVKRQRERKSILAEPARPGGIPLDRRIRDLRARGYSRHAIAGALRVSYATIEQALAGGGK